MRGKLRDKRSIKRDVFKREVGERKRTTKHNDRLAPWINGSIDEQEDELLDELNEEEAEAETIITILPQPQTQKI